MRANVLAFVLLLLNSIGFSALPDSSYGFVGGMSSFNQIIKNSAGAVDDSYSSDLGLYLGVFGERYLSSSWVLSPGIYFSQKGAKDNSGSRRANYLETSALLRWYFSDGPRLRSYFGFGGAFGILMSAEDAPNSGGPIDKAGSFSRNELSAQLGWGIEFPVAEDTGMQVGLTYSRSLTNFLNPAAAGVGGNQGTWNGFYGFVALRFKSQKESNTVEDRARDYLKYKKSS
ncbi:MAG: outer membrane beta-barrel protein [Pseudomonadota bacterium]